MKIKIQYFKPVFENNKIISYNLFSTYNVNGKSGGDIFSNLDKYIIDKKENHKDKLLHKIDEEKIINNLEITAELTLFNIKELIFNFYNIDIENQHIEYIYNNTINNFDYDYILKNHNTNLSTLMKENLNENQEYIENIPIDYDLYINRSLYTIKEYSKFKKIYDIIPDKNLIINIYNLEDFILDKTLILNIIKKDEEGFNVIFKGFIEKYFPMYDKNMFISFLENNLLKNSYSYLNVNKNDILIKIKQLSDLHKIKKPLHNTTFIKSADIFINGFSNEPVLNIQKIFNDIVLNDYNEIIKLEAIIKVNDRNVYLEKIRINNAGNLIIKKLNQSPDCILIIMNLFEKQVNVIIDNYNNIFLTISLDNKYKLTSYIAHIKHKFNEIINKINKNIKTNISYINEYNTNIKSVNIEDIYPLKLDINQYSELLQYIKEYERLEIYEILSSNTIEEKILITILYKNINEIDDKKIEEINNDSYFSIYNDSKLYNKYNKDMYTSELTIVSRINDLKINYISITLEEYTLISTVFSKILTKITTKSKKKNSDIISKSNSSKIKLLKESDPALYAINKDLNSLYSRKCQSNQQPSITNLEEIKSKNIKNYIKYHNFTKNTSEYYYCDNKQFPYVKFLTDVHPDKFCMPCCKKKSIDDVKIFSSYEDKHNKCLTNFSYSKDKEALENELKSRYIINYSNKNTIEPKRLMEIPYTLKKLFNTSFTEDKKTKYYIYGIEQNLKDIENVSILYIMKLLMNKSIEHIIDIFCEFLLKNKEYFNKLLNGKILNYYYNSKSLILDINKKFKSNDILNNSFLNWNELFIDISKYLGYIFIIFNESDNQTTNDSKIDINIPNNISKVTEIIYDIDSYNYVLILRRNIDSKLYYYPIFKINSKQYFYNNDIYQKLYKYSDPIIYRLKLIISTNISSQTKYLFDLNLINEFVESSKSYKIKNLFINKKNNVYAVLLKNNDKFIYTTIEESKIENLNYDDLSSNSLYENKYIELSEYKITFINSINFINDINLFIFEKNKKLYNNSFYNDLIDKLAISNKKYINSNSSYYNLLDSYNNSIIGITTYLRIKTFIIYNGNVIGMTCNNNNIYFSKKESIGNISDFIENELYKINKILYKKLKSKYIKNILVRNLLAEDNKKPIYNDLIKKFEKYDQYFITYKYNPHEINNILIEPDFDKNDRRDLLKNEAVYNTNLYNLLLLHLNNSLSKYINKKVRSEIKLILSNFTKKDIEEVILTNDNNKIKMIILNENSSLIECYTSLISIIKTLIIDAKRDIKLFKKSILNYIDTNRFDFDNTQIYKLLKSDKETIINIIDKILSKSIIHKKINENYNLLDLSLCNKEDSYYCKNSKFIIPKNSYRQILDILAYDLTNPFKQSILLKFKKIENSLYTFDNNINEKIFIYY